MSKPEITPQNLSTIQMLAANGPACLIIKAKFEPLGGQDRFQPAGFPEMGHVIYDIERNGKMDHVCIVDSAASMANHLETLCFSNPSTGILHSDLAGLPYVRCVTDPDNKVVVTTLSEGHRLASDYFLDGKLEEQNFRETLRKAFDIIEIKKDKTYFITPDNWWSIYTTIFRFDPNSLIHGVLFAKEQIKISRLLTAHLEAFGAKRVGSSGVKFDRIGKTTSGQPIFSRDEETAELIEGTFLIDLGLLRSYGHGVHGLNESQKRMLLEFALWKITRMLHSPFRFRSGCHLQCTQSTITDQDGAPISKEALGINLPETIQDCSFPASPITDVYYASKELFKAMPEKTSDEDNDQAKDEEEP